MQKCSFTIHGIYLCNMESIYGLSQIEIAAKEFIRFLDGNNVVAFHGNLGAGKTTFIQAVCHQLGVKENVSSPTFSIINQYTTPANKTIFHIDLYRVKDDEEAFNAGVEECIYSGNLCFIEWPERISFLPDGTLHVFIEPVNESKRRLLCKLPS